MCRPFISLFYYLFIYIFSGQTFKVEDKHTLSTSHAQEEQRDIANKNTRFNRSSGNAVNWPVDLVVQGSIPAGGENRLKSKLGYTAHSLSLPPTYRPDMIEILLKRP